MCCGTSCTCLVWKPEVRTRKPETPMDGLDHALAVLDVVPVAPEDDLGILVGHHGEQLGALQYSVNLILSHSYDNPHPITVDVDGYKRGREESLNALALDMAARVRDTREAITLDPMPPADAASSTWRSAKSRTLQRNPPAMVMRDACKFCTVIRSSGVGPE